VLIPQKIIRLRVAPLPPPPHVERPECPSPLLAALLREKFAGEIGDVDLVQQVNDSIRPVVGGVLKPDVEVPNNKGGAVCGARLPCHSEIFHPRRTVGGDVDLHDVIPLVAHDKLEGHQVWGQGPYGLDLKTAVVLSPDEAYSSLVWAGCFQSKYSISQEGLHVFIVGDLRFGQDPYPDPHLHQLLSRSSHPYPHPTMYVPHCHGEGFGPIGPATPRLRGHQRSRHHCRQ
jgi:hypothetical protein